MTTVARSTVVVLLGLCCALAGATTTAHAAGPTQDALCDGYGGTGGCRVLADPSRVNLGSHLDAVAHGNPGVEVSLRAYLVEFNSDGAITGLVPAGSVAHGRTRAVGSGQGITSGVRLTPAQPAGHPSGGWLFVGLADDTGLDLTRRLGTLVEYGGDTVRLLGDGWAAQKPVGEEIVLDVIGHVDGVKYWVEYQDHQGRWVPVPGEGFHESARLRGSPSERQQLTYTVPGSLTPGRSYQFRVNTELNYAGSPDRPVAKPAFVEWTVVPSGTPVARGRGRDFDPGLAPGTPDPTGVPAPQPSGAPSGSPQPSAGPAPAPSASPSRRPDQTGRTPSAGPTGGAGGATATPTAAGTAGSNAPTTPAAPAATATATGSPNATGTVAASPSASGSPAGGSVWGDEAPAQPVAGAVLPASSRLRWVLGLAGAVLVAGPAAWWALARRRDRHGAEEVL